MTEEIRSIILGRVSTADQKTVPAQIDGIQEECNKRGEIVVKIIEETHSVSSKDTDIDVLEYIEKIPAIKEIIELAKQKFYNKLWVWKWDRLSRDVAFQELIVRILKTYGVECESLLEGANPMTRRIMGSVANEETDAKRQRIMLGLDREFKKGKWMYRPCFGYRLNKKRKMLIEKESESEIYKSMIKDVLAGEDLFQLSKKYNTTMRMLHYRLNNKAYLGFVRSGGKLIKGRHTPLISQEDFDRVQQIEAERKIKLHRPKNLESLKLLSKKPNL